MPEPEPQPQTARPEAVRTVASFPPVSIQLTEHLWLHWAKIAIRQERRAWAARRAGQQETAFAPHLAKELEESIEAVAAARHCIHNLYRVWQGPLGLSSQQDMTLQRITRSAPVDPATWMARVKGLVGDRDDAVHHDEQSASPRPHPGYQTNVSDVAAVFTAERASDAVSIMLDDVIRPVLTAPSAGLADFAERHGHLLGHLDQQRATGSDLW